MQHNLQHNLGAGPSCILLCNGKPRLDLSYDQAVVSTQSTGEIARCKIAFMNYQGFVMAQFTVSDLMRKERIIVARSTDDVKTLQKLLWDSRIYSCPVVNDDGKVVSLIDLVDIVYFHLASAKAAQELVWEHYLNDEARKKAKEGSEFVDYEGIISLLDKNAIEKLGKQGLDHNSVEFVSNLSLQNEFITVSPKLPMKDLMSLLSHHHRVVVLSDEGKLMGYVTQSDLVKFLLDHDLLGDLGQRSLKELHLGTRRDDIISIGPREKVAEGFKKLILRKSHSVAVLDGEGKLVSGLDISNIKGVGPAGLIERLYMVWEDYVQLMFQQTGYKFEAPMSTSTTITLKQLLSSLVSHHHHHCYLVDASKIVEGVVSLGDVLLLLVGDCVEIRRQ
eukprot:TRINITY_DN2406_c0_g1_i30.p1 TRINITY_DN2406_c0_g1~~TRINITY_DN2406_c0_g1_i30.p1  ORF type:complete len:401 (+),score=69.18 TRINITY_DN2406_c0_g1_i30:34-1203(+)